MLLFDLTQNAYKLPIQTLKESLIVHIPQHKQIALKLFPTLLLITSLKSKKGDTTAVVIFQSRLNQTARRIGYFKL